MALLFESGLYCAISITDATTNIFYVIMFTSESYIIKDNTTIDGQLITAVELVVKAQYLCYMQRNTNWYWDQHTQHHVITVPTRIIPHPRLEVNAITGIHDIPKVYATRHKQKNPYQDILYVLLTLTMIKS